MMPSNKSQEEQRIIDLIERVFYPNKTLWDRFVRENVFDELRAALFEKGMDMALELSEEELLEIIQSAETVSNSSGHFPFFDGRRTSNAVLRVKALRRDYH